jgi:hypothetical protein
MVREKKSSAQGIRGQSQEIAGRNVAVGAPLRMGESTVESYTPSGAF